MHKPRWPQSKLLPPPSPPRESRGMATPRRVCPSFRERFGGHRLVAGTESRRIRRANDRGDVSRNSILGPPLSASTAVERVMEKLLAAIAELPVPVVAATGPNIDPGGIRTDRNGEVWGGSSVVPVLEPSLLWLATLRQAVQSLLEDVSYRHQARWMQGEIDELPPTEMAAVWIEALTGSAGPR